MKFRGGFIQMGDPNCDSFSSYINDYTVPNEVVRKILR